MGMAYPFWPIVREISCVRIKTISSFLFAMENAYFSNINNCFHTKKQKKKKKKKGKRNKETGRLLHGGFIDDFEKGKKRRKKRGYGNMIKEKKLIISCIASHESIYLILVEFHVYHDSTFPSLFCGYIFLCLFHLAL